MPIDFPFDGTHLFYTRIMQDEAMQFCSYVHGGGGGGFGHRSKDPTNAARTGITLGLRKMDCFQLHSHLGPKRLNIAHVKRLSDNW